MSETDREKWDRRYREGAYAGRTHPSAFVREHVEQVTVGRALDLACGAGRNALYLAGKGFAVDAVDISGAGLDAARARARESGLEINWLQQDLEEPLDLEPGYQLILLVRYVNRPLLHRLAGLLAPGGFLLCEEHLETGAEVVGPTNPAFRVRAGELADAAGPLEVLYLEEGLVTEPDGSVACLARLVARN